MNKKTPLIFGILNVTPDSFSDGGTFNTLDTAVTQAHHLLESGADFIDIGGQSTRPGAMDITCEEEWSRVEPVLNILLSDEKIREKISLDTLHSQTANMFLQKGGTIINSVNGAQGVGIGEIVARFSAKIIINHFPGRTVSEVHEKNIDSVNQVADELLSIKDALMSDGVSTDCIILDPGIGFGKTMTCNESLLKFGLTVPTEKVMIGYSRKRFLGLDRMSREKNNEAAQLSARSGAWALRVHEVPDL